MKTIKVFQVFLAVLLGCTRESKSTGYVPQDDIQVNFEHYDNGGAPNAEECFCLPRNPQGIHVSEHLSFDGEQDRLVVYLYKNKNNKVIIYVPKREKQILLPDLTLDDDDELNLIEAERVADLFYIFPKLSVPKVQAKPDLQNVFDSSLPSNTNSPFTPIIMGNLNGVRPQIYDPYNNEIKFMPGKRITPLTKPGNNVNANLINKVPNSNDRFLFYNGLDKTFPQISDTLSSPDKRGNEMIFGLPNVTPDIPNVSEYVTNHQYFPSVNGLPGNGNLNAYTFQTTERNEHLTNRLPLKNMQHIRNPLNEENRNPNAATPETDTNRFLKLPLIFTPDQDLHRVELEKDHKYSILDKIIHVPTPGVIDKYKADVSNLDNSRFRPQNDAFYTPYNQHSNQLDTSPGKGFESWFQNQIALIQRNRHSKSQAIDRNELRTFIMNALHKNGIRVNKDGSLVDSNGNFLDLANLQLRPILLGDPAEYNKLVAAQKCVIPHKLPYLEAVLVTLKYPPKILGIVPLGKTFKQILHETKQLCKHHGNKPACVGNHCNKDKLNLLLDNGRPSVYLNPKSNNLLNSYIKNNKKTVLSKSGNIEDNPSIQTIKLPDDIESYKLEDDEDSLDLKIIGGKPAVSSGVIVQNKGRSLRAFD
ncbi:uncharacterized protein LOC124537963 [Vanessa cardui]|uniref:uncharacterized protein LOC124537963 n=1 Tax=Vanessa cardui TaxID=171605 RepID=UPI001F130C24|nr:uncharacterized protein LOC124537963 [Vanessa cardui]